MSTTETVYFLATGEAEQAMREFRADYIAVQQATKGLLNELGASEMYYNGTFNFFLLKPEAPVPAGLVRYSRSARGRGDYRPDKTPEGKALALRIKELPRWPDRSRLTEKLRASADVTLEELGSLYGYHEVGEQFVISAQSNWQAPALPTCIPIKTSDYWRMVEALREREAAEQKEQKA